MIDENSVAVQMAVMNNNLEHLSTQLETRVSVVEDKLGRRIAIIENKLDARPGFVVNLLSPIIAGLSLLVSLTVIIFRVS